MPNKPTVLPKPMCEVKGCGEPAIQGFRIYERTDSSTASGLVLTSATRACASHLEMVSKSYMGQPGLEIVNFSG